MLDERDLSLEKGWYYAQLAKRCITSLKKNNIDANYAATRDEARSKVMGMIPPGATVGLADSVTLRQIGVLEELESGSKHRIFNPLRWEELSKVNYVLTPDRVDEIDDTMRKALTADVFVIGVNAVTLDGKLVSIDAHGNRVAGMIFGPKKVIVVAGANKIVKDVDAAIRRIKDIAAPMNARRHVLKHGRGERPCSIAGVCVDCKLPNRMCCVTAIVEFAQAPPPGQEHRLNVILVGEELGI